MNGAQSCDLYPFAAIGSEWQRFAAVGGRPGAFGGVRGRSGAKAKKANGFLRKPNNPRLYDDVTFRYVIVSLTHNNVTIMFAESPKM